jgi:hypothetical protein
MAGKWLQAARERMEAKGTVGKFGKATPKKISKGLKAGGTKKKEAVFAAMAKRHFKPLPKGEHV